MGHKHTIAPQSKKRGHMPPLPPPPLPTPVIIISYLVCETQVSRFPSTQENRSTHTCGTYLHKTNTIINTDHAKGTILIHKMCKKPNPKTPNNNNKQPSKTKTKTNNKTPKNNQPTTVHIHQNEVYHTSCNHPN